MSAAGVRSAERYGGGDRRRSERLLGYALMGVLLALLGAWAVWVALSRTPEVDSRLVGYHVDSDRAVTVQFDVLKAEEDTVACTVRAVGSSFEVVGEATVTVPSGKERARVRYHLVTSDKPAGADVAGCRVTDHG